MGFCTQYCALLRKNFILKRRQWLSTVFELVLPAIVFLVLVLVKGLLPPKTYQESTWLNATTPFNQTSRLMFLAQTVELQDSLIGFYPSEPSTELRDYLTNNGFPANRLITFENSEEVLNYIDTPKYGDGVPFLNSVVEIQDLNGPSYQYALRFNSTDSALYSGTPDVREAPYDLYNAAYTKDWRIYDTRGFSLFQDIIDTFILTKESVYTWPDPPGLSPTFHDAVLKSTFQPMPTIEYKVDDFTTIIGETLGFVLTLIFIWPLTRIISGLVEEKELKLKASMSLMGLSGSALFFSWLTTYAIMFGIITILLCLCSFWGLYSYSFIIFIFIIYWFFGMTVFAVGYLISAFFDNAKTASTFGSIVFLLTFFVSLGTGDSATSGTKVVVCLIPTACLAQIGSVASSLEGLQVGVNPSTISEQVKNFSVATGIGMLLFDFILYTLLGLYFNQTVSSHFGISLPSYFLCMPRWWCGTKTSRRGTPCGCLCTEQKSDLVLPPFDPTTSNEPETALEKGTDEDEPMIQIRNLRKTFPGTSGEKEKGCCKGYPDFVAVKGFSLDIYKNSITTILGENGAGKSTMFNMLTGLTSPTEGEALVNGYSINSDLQQIYRQQGVCFQHDVLYPNLTVYEHMKLFASIKQMEGSTEEINDHIYGLIDTVGLGPKGDNKANSLSSTLSGGQKRKLSVAIALLNNPSVLFLDELSTGVDVASTKFLWSVLLSSRKDRAIVLITHDMGEAQAISDRIAIMAAGKLMCAGSNLFLQQQYGVGYTLTINKDIENLDTTLDQIDDEDDGGGGDDDNNNSNNTTPTNTNQPQSDDRTDSEKAAKPSTKSGKRIFDVITNKYKFAILSNDTAGEIAFRLPLTEAKHFPEMIDYLEAEKSNLLISTFGLGVTSLTEVFLRVISGQSREENFHDVKVDIDEDDKKKKKKSNKTFIDETWGSTATNIDQLSTMTIFFRHFSALFLKRLHNFKRDGKSALWTLVYPGIILLGGMLALKFAVVREFPRREMSANLYPIGTEFVVGNTITTNPFISNIYSALRSIGTDRYQQDIINAGTNDTSIAGFQDWLLATYNDRPFTKGRFGGVMFTEAENIPTIDPALPPQYEMTLFMNSTAQDALPSYRNLISNALLATTNPDATITLQNAPLPRTKRLLSFINSTTAFIVAIAMSFVPASFAAYVVRERTDQVKHLQMVSGVSNIAYWSATMAWDCVNFILPFLLFITILFSFDVEPFMEPAGVILIIVSLWLFVLASCPFTYALSFLFDSHTTAQNMTLLINFMTSVVLLILSFLLTIIESTRSANKILRFFYRLLPGYTLGDVFMQLLLRKQIYPNSKSPWELNIAGWDLIFFVVDFILYTGLLILLEHWSSNNTLEWMKGGCKSIAATDDEKFRDPEEDDDVKKLRESIEAGKCDNVEQYPVVLKGLRKVYPNKGKEPFMAVSNVFFNVQKGTVLSLLGANGAGKSTTMKLLTSDTYPSAGTGDCTIGGFSLLHQSEKIRHLLGYCPQFDALLPLLTAREHLELYAAIKCVPKDKIPGYVNFMLQKLGLVHLADRSAGKYSGGNKRKLSLGIALIGNPKVLLLDEISSGVDPSSRRILWNLLSSTMKNRAVILTTHSMEEAEALSTYITIMASGRLRCYGTSLHLKQRHGNALQVELLCQAGKQNDVKEWFKSKFDDVTVVEEHRLSLKYAIPKRYHISDAFRIMEEAKTSNIGIESYSVSETTLDQIFIKFIRQDDERRAKNDGKRT